VSFGSHASDGCGLAVAARAAEHHAVGYWFENRGTKLLGRQLSAVASLGIDTNMKKSGFLAISQEPALNKGKKKQGTD
jgi:hypothetical protein